MGMRRSGSVGKGLACAAMRAYDTAYAEAKGETEADALHNVAFAIERMIADAPAVGPAGFAISKTYLRYHLEYGPDSIRARSVLVKLALQLIEGAIPPRLLLPLAGPELRSGVIRCAAH